MFIKNLVLKISHFLPDRLYLQLKYWQRMYKWLNLKDPQTFSEKLQWLKLYDRNPFYTTLVDKYAVKQYITDKIGARYVIPTLGVWDSFDEIDFNNLPNQFVLKTTHDSGGVVIVKDKKNFDRKKARAKLTKSLKHDYYYHGREWPYKNVPHRIIAERFMQDNKSPDLRDYKFFCFNGEPKLILLASNRFGKEGLKIAFYDVNWQKLPFTRPSHPMGDSIEKPVKLGEMLSLARTLAKDIPFARIDFYVIEQEVYFGEITLYPASGFDGFNPPVWDRTIGEWLVLPLGR